VVFLTFAIVVGGAIIWYASGPARERKKLVDAIEAVPPLERGETTEGTLVRVTGRVQILDATPGGELRAPFSDKRCVWFKSETALSSDEGARRFLLERVREAPVVIDPTHARVAIAPLDSSEYYSTRALAYSLEHRDSDGGGVYMKETVITPGMRVTVAGTLVRERGDSRIGSALESSPGSSGERGYRDDPEPQLVLAGSADHPLAIAIADPL
jgi:hypothetical protein